MVDSNYIRVIPTTYDIYKTEKFLSQYQDWFYKYKFSNNVTVSPSEELVNEIHQTRADIIFPFLDEILFKDNWKDITCVDIACNQGWFSTQIALRGAKKVVGFDIRNEHLKMANVIKEIGELNNLTYFNQNLFDLDDKKADKYDLVLFLGLLYHIENPMGALRKARSLTRNVCIIETQVARSSSHLEILNGSDTRVKNGHGIGVFPSDEGHAQDGLSIVIVPTLDALYQMMYAAGFKRLYLSIPPSNLFEQYPNFDRIIIFAQV